MARPKIYKNVEDMEKDINNYFSKCDKKKKPYTICGLCNCLDIDRKTLINYSKDDKFFHTIKNAKLKVEEQLEENLYRLGNNSGIIFNLKNNFGWKDTVEVNQNEELDKLDELLGEIKNASKQ